MGHHAWGTAALRAQVPGVFVRVAGTATHVVVDEGPDAAPPVLFASGLGGAWYDWDAVAALLAGRAPLVRFDRPGLGWSQASPVAPTLEAEAGRIGLLLDALGMRRPCLLVGHGLGGFHVEAFARLYPHRVAGVVLADGSCEPDAIPPAVGAEQGARRWRRIGAVTRASGLGALAGPAARRLAVAAGSYSGSDAADPDVVAAVFAAARPATAVLLERAAYRQQATQLLELRCERPFPPVPLRVLAGSGASRAERVLLPGTVTARMRDGWRMRQRGLAEMSPSGRFLELPDSAHLVLFDRPDAVADAVLALAEVCAGPENGPRADVTARCAAG